MDENLEPIGEFLLLGTRYTEFLEALASRVDAGVDLRPHPLGFLRFTLGACSLGLIHLHCWPGHGKYIQSPSATIHQHSVAVVSFVILGQLRDAAFSWQESLEGDRRLLAQSREVGGPRLVSTERVGRLQFTGERLVSRGERYSIPYGGFHETRVEWSSIVATVAMFVRTSDKVPLVAVPHSEGDHARYDPPRLTVGESEGLVAQIRIALGEEIASGRQVSPR